MTTPDFHCLCFVLFATCCFAGCGGASSPPPPPPPPSLSISPMSVNVAAGGPQQFVASTNGNSNPAVTWQVNGVAGGNSKDGTISSAGLYIAPYSAANVVITAALVQSNASVSASANVTVLAPHRIAVRPAATLAEFYDVDTGSSFVPRGNNYIRLATQNLPSGGQTFYHSTFNVGMYDASMIEIALASMQSSGSNTARVWINGCCQNSVGDPAGGLSPAYLANVVDFLQRAKTHAIFVIFSTDSVPALGGYTNSYANCTNFGGYNTLNLCAGGVQAHTSFFHDLALGLVNQGADLDAVLAYELRNEYYYEADQSPLNWTSGAVTTADGQTYDMSNPASQQQMMWCRIHRECQSRYSRPGRHRCR